MKFLTALYRHTGEKRYLDAAKKVANYFITACAEDLVPRCDFRQPQDAVAYDSGDNALDTTRVSASHGEHTLSISIPEGWEYEIKEYSGESSSFGIFFWPEGETEGKLSFLYYDAWGVCGTGLESETIEIGGYEASQGNYNGGIWEFICFQKEPGWCVIKNDTARAWLGKYMDEAMEIIDTVRVK